MFNVVLPANFNFALTMSCDARQRPSGGVVEVPRSARPIPLLVPWFITGRALFFPSSPTQWTGSELAPVQTRWRCRPSAAPFFGRWLPFVQL